jgi:asparagine synthase (glutamine-hydrolysing)
MCGIAGSVDTSRPVDVATLERMTECIRHRGPDDGGVFQARDGRVGLAFRRLSILDLSPAGHQPMTTPDGGYAIVFNGEVYNFAELRPELEARGHVFRSHTDTEVILRAYQEWGPKCVQRFIGMFALAVWDESRGVLFMARDRLGIKPLYYAERAGHLAFASELKPLMIEGSASGDLDATALGEFLAAGYVSAPRSIYRSVRSLPPGHTLTWSSGTASVERYWDPVDWIGSGVPDRTEDQMADELDELLRSSVKYRLVSDVPLGAFLSGGIDSSLVVALMRAVSNADVRTYSVGFEDRTLDEAAAAAAVARHLGTIHTSLTATEREAQGVVPSLPLFYDEPFADSSQIPTYLVSRLTRQHVTVALSGDGGDELFAGYQNYSRMATLERRRWNLPASVRALASATSARLPESSWSRALDWLGSSSPAEYADKVWRIWRQPAARAIAPALRDVADEPQESDTSSRLNGLGLSTIERMMLTDLQRYLPNDILTKVDRASMAVSLEARVPLLDHRVVQFALGLPLDAKWKHGRTKVLLRKVLARYVPPALTERPKQGFAVPLSTWLRGDLKPLLLSHLSPERIRHFGVLDADAVGRRVTGFVADGKGAVGMWSLLMLQMWLDRYHPAGGVTVS